MNALPPDQNSPDETGNKGESVVDRLAARLGVAEPERSGDGTVSRMPRDPAEEARRQSAEDRYERMNQLADFVAASGEELRERSRLGEQILADPDVADSAPLSPRTWGPAEEDIRNATGGKHGLEVGAAELEADALGVRATVLTYRWIDELAEAAYHTLGAIASRAIGYLAPEVSLGGEIVTAGLIETDALDRDGLASYLNELADSNPELMDHLTSGGGGLLDSLQMRALLTAGVMGGPNGSAAARGGLSAIGANDFETTALAALRDVAPGYDDDRVSVGSPGGAVPSEAPAGDAEAPLTALPVNVEGLMEELAATDVPVRIEQTGERFIAYLPGARPHRTGARLRLVGSDRGEYTDQVVAALTDAIDRSGAPHPAPVMLVGGGQGGLAATEIAAGHDSDLFRVDQVITAGAPAAQVPSVPVTTTVLALEDRSDPIALLGSLINAGQSNRLTVVFDGGSEHGSGVYTLAGRAADSATHPDLVAAIAALREQGFLASS